MKFVHTITHTFRHAFFISETCKIGSSRSIMKKGKTSFRINYILQLLLLHTYTIVQPKQKGTRTCVMMYSNTQMYSIRCITQKILLFDVIPPFITCCCTRSYYIKQTLLIKRNYWINDEIPTIENVPFFVFWKDPLFSFLMNHSETWLKNTHPSIPYTTLPASTHHYPLAEKGRAM